MSRGSCSRRLERRYSALGAIGTAQRPAPPPPPAPPLPMPAILKAYPPVTAERLVTPADDEWLMIRRTYDGWGYSPLDQITAANVARLQPVWIFSTGVTNGHEAAADRERRRDVRVHAGQPGHRASTPGPAACCGATAAHCRRTRWCCTRRRAAWRSSATRSTSPANEARARGARCAHRRGSVDAPGRPRTSSGYYMTLAPLVADGKVMIGASGRRVRHSRLRRRLRRRDRQAGLEDLHGAGAG